MRTSRRRCAGKERGFRLPRGRSSEKSNPNSDQLSLRAEVVQPAGTEAASRPRSRAKDSSAPLAYTAETMGVALKPKTTGSTVSYRARASNPK